MKLKFLCPFGIVHFLDQNQPTMEDSDRSKLYFPILFWRDEHHYSRCIDIDFSNHLPQDEFHGILVEHPFYSSQINFLLCG